MNDINLTRYTCSSCTMLCLLSRYEKPMKAYTHKSKTSDGNLTKHYVGKNERGDIIISTRHLVPVKYVEKYNLLDWEILKHYKGYLLIEKSMPFFEGTANFLSCAIGLLNDNG